MNYYGKSGLPYKYQKEECKWPRKQQGRKQEQGRDAVLEKLRQREKVKTENNIVSI